ncbi:MAG: radical SAM protein [Clostridia bacterium]|nr:radical SAM protein [Clostridia bacterium]
MEKSVRHYSIPVFVPHEGCPNTCLFCNQRKISGKARFDPDSVREEIDTCLSTIPSGSDVQIAFFGGSFTAIERELMLYLLGISDGYVERGLVDSVRLSTRPDAVGEEILDILSCHHVKDVELGIQSTDDTVLLKNARGHNAETAISAMKRVVDHGFRLTGQMMTGMYSASAESEIQTARTIVECGAVSTRIYPTVVFRDTGLEALCESGEFKPLSLEESVERTLAVYRVFKEAGVKVLRIGLCSTDGVRGEDSVSVYDEAMGERVLSRDKRDELEKRLSEIPFEKGDTVLISVPSREISVSVGFQRENKLYLENKYGIRLKIKGV